MIDQLIQQVCTKLGIPADQAQQAVGVLMGFFKKKGDPAAVGELFNKVPGAADLAGQFEGMVGSQGGGGGLLGGLMSKLGGAKAGNMMEAVTAFQKTGLSVDQAKEMLPVAKDFLEQNAGSDVVARALESVPALKGLLR